MQAAPSSNPQSSSEAGANWKSYLVPMAIALFFLAWALFIFFAVGTKWPPAWRYGSVPMTPGLSPYSTTSMKQFYTNPTSPAQKGQVDRQHVMGAGNNPDFQPGGEK